MAGPSNKTIKRKLLKASDPQLNLLSGFVRSPKLTQDIAVAVPSPDLWVKKGEPKPTAVYDTYWKFASKRQDVFFRRIKEGVGLRLTSDQILSRFKFTNTYRASDRVSQYLIRHIIYKGSEMPEEVFFRTLLFKLFNKIETWELLEKELGPVSWNEFNFDRFNSVLAKAIESGQRIYSAAYIMPSGRSAFGFERKHQNHLKLIEAMMEQRLASRIVQLPTFKDVFELLLRSPGIGPFLAYQYAIDLNYSKLINFSEDDFVVPGPGALSGIEKCFSSIGDYAPADVIRWVKDRQEIEFRRLNLDFKDLWGRHLHLIDCQNLFCETDKYARVAHPEFLGASGRTKIKQKYKATPTEIDYFYPPKWGLNEKIQSESD